MRCRRRAGLTPLAPSPRPSSFVSFSFMVSFTFSFTGHRSLPRRTRTRRPATVRIDRSPRPSTANFDVRLGRSHSTCAVDVGVRRSHAQFAPGLSVAVGASRRRLRFALARLGPGHRTLPRVVAVRADSYPSGRGLCVDEPSTMCPKRGDEGHRQAVLLGACSVIGRSSSARHLVRGRRAKSRLCTCSCANVDIVGAVGMMR